MKTVIFIVLIVVTRFTLAQGFSEFERLIQITDSIRTNVRIHGPHTDGLNKSVTYYQIDEHNYIKTTEIYVNDTIKEYISWSVFKGEPIVFHKQEIILKKRLNLEIVYFISNKTVIGLQCIGYINSRKVLEVENLVEKELENKNWL